jgi:hypothetical protein
MRFPSAWKVLALAVLSLRCAHVEPPPELPGHVPVHWLQTPDQARVSGLTASASDYFATGGLPRAFVARFTRAGQAGWVRTFGGTGESQGEAVAVAADGAPLVVGKFSGRVDFGGVVLQSQGPQDCFVGKLSPQEGQVLWAVRLGDAEGVMTCRSVTGDAAGDLFVTGMFSGRVTLGAERFQSAGLNDLFLLKLSGHDGAPLWARRLGGAGEDVGRDVAVTPSGSVLVTGLFSQGVTPEAGAIDFGTGNGPLTSQGDADAFLAAFAADDGHTQWARALGGPTYDQAKSVVVTPDGSIFLTGLFQREDATPAADGTLFNAGGFEGFLAAFSPLGSERWSHRWPAMTSGHALALTAEEQLVLVGHFKGTLELGPGVRVLSTGQQDVVVAGFSTTGDALWAQALGKAEDDYGYAVAALRGGVAVGGDIPPERGSP